MSFVASKIYAELGDLDLKDIKKYHKDKRQKAKSAGFAINYGGNGYTISENLGISVEEGDKIYNAYLDAFPGLKNYFDKQKREALKLGYIKISDVTNRKYFISNLELFRELEKEVNEPGFWTKYRSSPSPILKERVKKYFKWKSAIERLSLNYPIQGSSAEITKIAGILMFDWIIQKDLQGVVKIVNVVHDEYIVECPEHMAEEISSKVKYFMEKAGEYYCKIIPLVAEPEISKVWQH